MLTILLIAGQVLLSASVAAPDDGVAKLGIGVAMPEYGDESVDGEYVLNGIQLATEQINAQGGIDGRRIQLIVRETQSRGEIAMSAAHALIDVDSVPVVIGGVSDDVSLGLSLVCSQGRTPLVCTSAGDPWVTNDPETGVLPYVFRSCLTDSAQGTVMATFAIQHLRARRFAMIVDTSTRRTTLVAEAFERSVTAQDGTIVARWPVRTSTRSGRRQAKAIARSAPDAVFMATDYGNSFELGNALSNAGCRATMLGWEQFFSPWSGADSRYRHVFNGCYVTSPDRLDETSEAVGAFRSAYHERFGTPVPDPAADGYDAMMLVARACRAASANGGGLDRESIRNALERLENVPTLHGPLTMTAFHNPRRPCVVAQFRNRPDVRYEPVPW